MSHRKFEAPRHGHLGFVPKRRSKESGGRARPRHFPKDNQKDKVHLTAFVGYKAGSTHIVREVNKPGSKIHKKEVVEVVTILETPPMVVIGVVGYYQTPFGLKQLGVVFSQHVANEVKRRVSKNYRGKKAFEMHTKNYNLRNSRVSRKNKLRAFAQHAKVIRVVAHTQINKLNLGNKRAHVAEIQVNGGNIKQKITFAYRLLEKHISVDQVFKRDELIDLVGITKGKGFKGVIARFGVRRLPRKTHKGLRKVACIGAWHPSRVSWTVARAGQKGYHNRTLMNKKIYMIGKSMRTAEGKNAGSTPFDLTQKGINPMGGFPHYGVVKEDFVMIKGSVMGAPRRVITLRKGLMKNATRSRLAIEDIQLKFIDTSSKIGHGKFQTIAEKKKFLGPMKKDLLKKQQSELAAAREDKKRKERE